jgi:hypothetical protein
VSSSSSSSAKQAVLITEGKAPPKSRSTNNCPAFQVYTALPPLVSRLSERYLTVNHDSHRFPAPTPFPIQPDAPPHTPSRLSGLWTLGGHGVPSSSASSSGGRTGEFAYSRRGDPRASLRCTANSAQRSTVGLGGEGPVWDAAFTVRFGATRVRLTRSPKGNIHIRWHHANLTRLDTSKQLSLPQQQLDLPIPIRQV